MTVMLQCSDARGNGHFKSQSALPENISAPSTDLVDNIAVQTLHHVCHPIIHWRVGHGARYASHRLQKRSGSVFKLISIILSGLFVGLAARYLYPGTVPMGLGRTILLGIAGSLVAGLAAGWGSNDGGQVSRAGCIASVLGAMVLIFIGRHL
jgi:uncharacterized membrane protein YeaQ/YmgE (transglycosylase-associated protein family)